MNTLEQKKELIDWISQLDNPLVLNTIYNFKQKSVLTFKERFSKAITIDEFKTEIKKRIQNYPIKNDSI
jgi:hypothetical protein